ncbi:MFS transporter [Thermasporomyces composti]|jgi:MFS family permease|uniref:Putative MFS family arabinose efflux permease n=1 Tax=Thermasporomyces composti TaxID=696763 RepID=A0A3D9V8W8_THECX|nr:MFS transporter [Thermasporomyces composti]REF37736.1 putative MFS family arabinose efflux permease [Thermasporomyces composti]
MSLLGEFRNPLRTLRHRDFRLLWTGEVLRTSAQWMDTITRGFLVLELVNSSAHLALVNAVRSAPLLVLGLLAGILADRVSRLRLLLASQTMNVVGNLAIAVLTFTGLVSLWHVYLTAVLIGFGMALNAPARQSALPSLVPERDLQSAVVLNTATLNIGQAIGPIIGGVSVGLVGVAGSYLVQAAMFAVAGLLIRRINLPARKGKPQGRLRDSAVDGIRYLRHHELLPGLLLISVSTMLLVQPFRGVVPAIAVLRLGLDATRAGLLMAALGAGSLLSVIVLAARPPVPRPGRRIVTSAVGFGVAITVFALSTDLVVAGVALFAAGLLQANNRTLTQSLVLSDTEDAYRGRVSSVWVVNRGAMPVGSTALAALTTVTGVGPAVAAMSVAGAIGAGYVGWRVRALWRR